MRGVLILDEIAEVLGNLVIPYNSAVSLTFGILVDRHDLTGSIPDGCHVVVHALPLPLAGAFEFLATRLRGPIVLDIGEEVGDRPSEVAVVIEADLPLLTDSIAFHSCTRDRNRNCP